MSHAPVLSTSIYGTRRGAGLWRYAPWSLVLSHTFYRASPPKRWERLSASCEKYTWRRRERVVAPNELALNLSWYWCTVGPIDDQQANTACQLKSYIVPKCCQHSVAKIKRLTNVFVKLYSDSPSQTVPRTSNRKSRLLSLRHSVLPASTLTTPHTPPTRSSTTDVVPSMTADVIAVVVIDDVMFTAAGDDEEEDVWLHPDEW